MVDLAAVLATGLAALQLDLEPAQQAKLCAYLELLEKWNRAYNLTAVRHSVDMVNRHLVDSLSVLPFLRGSRILDLGTGAGLPGIPVAIARREVSVVLLDGNGKKTRFCTQAIAELGLGNVEVMHARVENYRPKELFDIVVCRAFGSLATFVNSAGRLLHAGGRLVAMKGRVLQREMDEIPPEFRLVEEVPLTLPALKDGHRIMVFEPA
ncbi:MAG TPA: 16S rRNA (guanine(527)-N(7))-methyltransferase RsmG [Gammaproteobacteria bacterium]|jgi:16S rRNA (guanine527-N7)-methyltransferase|nr:16S rRNA (guanine(527)-N(7))-methyltransferase RsmG [Gammaproteobacteria bacterium]